MTSLRRARDIAEAGPAARQVFRYAAEHFHQRRVRVAEPPGLAAAAGGAGGESSAAAGGDAEMRDAGSETEKEERGEEVVTWTQAPPPPPPFPHCCPYPCPYCTLTPSLPIRCGTAISTSSCSRRRRAPRRAPRPSRPAPPGPGVAALGGGAEALRGERGAGRAVLRLPQHPERRAAGLRLPLSCRPRRGERQPPGRPRLALTSLSLRPASQQLKSARGCAYSYVEARPRAPRPANGPAAGRLTGGRRAGAQVMACPAGCVNGGGQLRVPEGLGAISAEAPKERLRRVRDALAAGQARLPPSPRPPLAPLPPRSSVVSPRATWRAEAARGGAGAGGAAAWEQPRALDRLPRRRRRRPV